MIFFQRQRQTSFVNSFDKVDFKILNNWESIPRKNLRYFNVAQKRFDSLLAVYSFMLMMFI